MSTTFNTANTLENPTNVATTFSHYGSGTIPTIGYGSNNNNSAITATINSHAYYLYDVPFPWGVSSDNTLYNLYNAVQIYLYWTSCNTASQNVYLFDPQATSPTTYSSACVDATSRASITQSAWAGSLYPAESQLLSALILYFGSATDGSYPTAKITVADLYNALKMLTRPFSPQQLQQIVVSTLLANP